MIAPQSTASSDPSAAVSAWDAYRAWPVRQVHAERIVACFGGAIEKTAAQRLQENPRFSARLKDMLQRHFDLPALDEQAPAHPVDALIATLASDDLTPLTTLSGMIRRGHIFASEIRSSVVRDHNSQFGEANVRLAIANRDLAVKAAAQPDSRDLEKLIDDEGNRCFSAWIDAQPHAIQAWSRMKMAGDQVLPQSVDQERTALDCEIVRRAAMALSDSGTKEIQR